MRTPAAVGIAALSLLLCACSKSEQYPDRPVTLICPWAVGGGTDRVSRQTAAFLEQELGVPVNVVNAVGGSGVTGHSRGLGARPDGYTVTMMTVEINILRHRKLSNISWEQARPLMSINEDPAAVFVRSDAPWKSMSELLEAVRREPNRLTASGTAVGAIWHLALAGWLRAAGCGPSDIRWIPMNGAAPSLQELLSGGIQIVCCSLPEARALHRAGHIRCLGVMAEARLADFPDVPTLREQGTDWVTVGWRGLAVPRDTPEPIAARLTAALERVTAGETRLTTHAGEVKTFPAYMAAEGFNSRTRGTQEFRRLLADTDARFGALLTEPAMAEVTAGRYGAMHYPFVLFAALGAIGAALAWGWFRAPSAAEVTATEVAAPVPTSGLIDFALVPAAVLTYLFAVETVGFVLTAAAILLALLIRLRTSIPIAAATAAGLAPFVYQVFAVWLRVPLPRGWLGW